jgi:hypothetical protein
MLDRNQYKMITDISADQEHVRAEGVQGDAT